MRADSLVETTMCGRFVQHSSPEVYASAFDLEDLCEAKPRYNLAPTQPVLAIRQTEKGTRELVPLRWGLVPSWSKGPDNRYSMINARAETVAAKPAYRNAFKHRRCLIPTEGFYEWKAGERGKTPYLIRRSDGEPFGMAGLWETWTAPDGEPLESCTVVGPPDRRAGRSSAGGGHCVPGLAPAARRRGRAGDVSAAGAAVLCRADERRGEPTSQR